MKVRQFLKKTMCLGLTAAMLIGTTSPVTAAHQHETAAGIVTEIMNETIDAAETVIDKQGLLDVADVTNTKDALEKADSNLMGSMDNLGTAVDNANVAIEALDGKVTKDDAAKINASLSVAYDEANRAWKEAVEVSDEAVVELEKAAAAYEAASQISDEAAKAAEAELKAAQEALNAAVEATKFANDNMVSLKNEFAKATELATKWSTEVETALAEATAKFEEAQAALNSALEALESGDAELRAAIDTFKACYDAFIEAAKTFKTSIQTAVEAQNTLEGLYAEYEAAQATYAEALAAYETKCAEYGAAGYPADYEALESETTRLNGELNAANEALKVAEENFAAAEKTYKFYEKRVAYLEALEEKNQILTSETATEEEKAEAAYSTAEVIVEQFIVAENVENNVWSEDTQIIKVPATGSEYGKSDYPFFVVIGKNVVTRNADNTFVIRYGYEINEETGAVEIFELVPVDTTNFIEYNGVTYELEEKNDGLFISVEGSKVDIYKEGTRYFEKITLDGQFVEDNTMVPKKVNIATIIDVEMEKIPDWAINLVKGISWVDLQYNEDEKYYYAFAGVQLGELSFGLEFPIDLVQDAQTGIYTAEYNYEVDIYSETCKNEKHMSNNSHDEEGTECINQKHIDNTSHEQWVCIVEGHWLTGEHELKLESDCLNNKHTNGYHEEFGSTCINQMHIDNKSCAKEGTTCNNQAHIDNVSHERYLSSCTQHEEDAEGNCIVWGTTCITDNHKTSEVHTTDADSADAKMCLNEKHSKDANGNCIKQGTTCTNKKHIGHAKYTGLGILYYVGPVPVCDSPGKCTYDQYGECNLNGVCTYESLGECNFESEDYGECTYDQYGECEYEPLGACIIEKYGWCDIVDYGKCEYEQYGKCEYPFIGTEPRCVEISCKYPEEKPQAEYAGVWYDVVDNKIVTEDTVISFTESVAGESYTYQVNVKFVPGGDANTFYARKESRSASFSEDLASLMQKKADAEIAYDETQKMLADAKTVQSDAQVNYDDYSAKLAELKPVYDTYVVAEKVATEKQLGELAELPKNISEMVEGMEVEEMFALLEAIVELSSQSDDVDYEKVLDVLADVVDANAAARLIWVLGYDAVEDGLDSILPFGLFDDIMGDIEDVVGGLIDKLTPPTEFEREYANAWVNALTTKINVVQNAIKLVEKAVATVEAGVTAVTEGIELAEVAADAVLATAEKKLLEATVEVLVMANDVLNSSEEIVLSIDSIIAEAQARTEKAYLAAVAERNALNQVTFERPYATELDEALVAIGAANALNAELTADIAFAEVSIGTAKILYEELKALEEHEHNYESVVTAPTCTRGGYTTHTCTVCSYTYMDSEVEPNGHKYETVTVEATCTIAGSVTKKCACGNTIVETISAKGHDYKTEVTAPSCTAGGYTTHTCACGDSYITDEVEALGHSIKSEVTAPTCEAEGYTTHTCSKCGYSYTDSKVAPAGHKWTEWSETVAPTEESYGEKVRECTVEDCDVKEVEKINPLPHTHVWNEGVITAPTCTAGGYTTYTCTKCRVTEVRDEVTATDHAYVTTETPATCTEAGYFTHVCSYCGKSYTTEGAKATGHTFGEWVVTKEATETETGLATRTCHCGETETQKIAKKGHTYTAVVTAPTCVAEGYTTYTCECGDSYVADRVPALGHSENAVVTVPTCTEVGYTTYTCTVCGSNRQSDTTEALGHSYVPTVTAPTCTEAGYTTYICTVCGANHTADTTNALGHSYGDWTVTKEATEETEGEQVRICATCGDKDTQIIAKKEHVHVFATAVVTDPTCEEAGYTTHICKCGETTIDAYVDALGHAWTEWTTVKEATKEEDGQKIRECERCDATETETVEFIPTLVTSITLDRTEASLKKGAKLQLIATVLPEEATDATVTWSTSDETIATVNEEGLVKAVKAGKVEITATANDGSDAMATCIITVKNPTAVPNVPQTPEVEETPVEEEIPEVEEIPVTEEEISVEENEEIAEEIEEEDEETVIIEEEDTPLADGKDSLVEIEDEDTPLANAMEEVNRDNKIGFAIAVAGGMGVVGAGVAIMAAQAGAFETATETGKKSFGKAIIAIFKKLFKK